MNIFKTIVCFFTGYRVTLRMMSGDKITFRCKNFKWSFLNREGQTGLRDYTAKNIDRYISFDLSSVESVSTRRCIYIRKDD